MPSRRGLLVLLVLTLAAVVAALIVVARRDSEVEVARMAPEPALPSLAAAPNEVARIELTQGENRLVLARNAQGEWSLADRTGWPARPEAIRQLLRDLSGLELVEAKTARPAYHARLDLVAPEEGGQALHVALFDDEGTSLGALLVGRRQEGQGTPHLFVRRPGEAQVWLAEGALNAPPQTARWADTSLLSLPRARIQAVAADPEEGPDWRLRRETPAAEGEAATFALETPEAERPLDPYYTTLLAASLEDLRFADLRAVEDLPAEPVAEARFTTFDGLELSIRQYRIEDRPWIALAAEGVGETAEEAAEINRRAQGRLFLISPDALRDLIPSLERLLVPPPLPTPATPPAALPTPGTPPAATP